MNAGVAREMEKAARSARIQWCAEGMRLSIRSIEDSQRFDLGGGGIRLGRDCRMGGRLFAKTKHETWFTIRLVMLTSIDQSGNSIQRRSFSLLLHGSYPGYDDAKRVLMAIGLL
jgi:hypothetical protein